MCADVPMDVTVAISRVCYVSMLGLQPGLPSMMIDERVELILRMI